MTKCLARLRTRTTVGNLQQDKPTYAHDLMRHKQDGGSSWWPWQQECEAASSQHYTPGNRTIGPEVSLGYKSTPQESIPQLGTPSQSLHGCQKQSHQLRSQCSHTGALGDIAHPHNDIKPLSSRAGTAPSYAQTTCFANSSANVYSGSFCFGTVINNTSGSICVQTFAWTSASSLGDISRSRIAELCGHLCLTF